MVLKKPHLYSVGSVIFALIITLSLFFWPVKSIELSTKFTISEQTRYALTPTWQPKKNEILFEIEIESFQNPSSLNVNFKDQLLLEDTQNQLYEPQKWRFILEDPTKVRALVSFKLKERSQNLSLKYFGSQNLSFEWKLPRINEY